jgi:SAM-dependent methyltransferase
LENVFDDVISPSGIPKNGRMLEIGCGTGQATVPFPRRGYRVLCAFRRERLFGWISDGRVVENGNASIVRNCWSALPDHYPHVSLDAFVIMPDHLHGIIVLRDTAGAGLESPGFEPTRSKTFPFTPRIGLTCS